MFILTVSIACAADKACQPSAKENERVHEPLSYLYLPFVISEHWSEIAWLLRATLSACHGCWLGAKDAKEIHEAARLAL